MNSNCPRECLPATRAFSGYHEVVPGVSDRQLLAGDEPSRGAHRGTFQGGARQAWGQRTSLRRAFGSGEVQTSGIAIDIRAAQKGETQILYLWEPLNHITSWRSERLSRVIAQNVWIKMRWMVGQATRGSLATA